MAASFCSAEEVTIPDWFLDVVSADQEFATKVAPEVGHAAFRGLRAVQEQIAEQE